MTPKTTPEDTTTPAAQAPTRPAEKTRARVDALRVHPRNPRKISKQRLEQLQRTLEAEPGMLDARPLIALPDGTVVAGNQRLLAARALGWEEIPVVFADLSEDEVTRWMLLDNRGFGEDDREAVGRLLVELEQRGGDLALTGYAADETALLLAELARTDADPDVTPDLPAEPRSVPGEVYVLGRHRVMCGDATNPAHVALLLDATTPALCVTDPPYGVEYDPAWRQEAAAEGHLAYADRRVGEVQNDDRADWEDAWRLVPADVVYAWSPPGSTRAVHQHALERAGFEIRMEVIWVKPHLPISRGHYHVRHEPCFYAVRRNKVAGWIGDRKQTTIWEIALDRNVEGGHSTQKPVECMERPIRNHTGDVYDPFCGSGTTLIACERQHRRCFAMEISPAYCDVIRQRYADYVGDPTLAP